MLKCRINKNFVEVIVFIEKTTFAILVFCFGSPMRLVFVAPVPDGKSAKRHKENAKEGVKAKTADIFFGFYMAIERTLSIIKPDAVAKNVIGQIVARFEQAGLKVVAARLQQLSRSDAERFYAVHKERPFYRDLVDFMVSGPVFVQVLEGENAIQKNRDLMGATDPKKAEPGTIRADFADSIDANAVHGSDAAQTAATEVAFFFPEYAIVSR